MKINNENSNSTDIAYMTMALVLINLILCLNSFLYAVQIHEDSLESVFAYSKEHPNSVVMIKVGTDSCPACNRMSNIVKEMSGSNFPFTANAYWNEVNTDKVTESVLRGFLNRIGAGGPEKYIPYTVAMKDGVAVAVYAGCVETDQLLEDFMKEIENSSRVRSNVNTSAVQLIHPVCGPRQSDSAYIIGVSGASNYNGTENFGRRNLIEFKELFRDSESAKLFGPQFTDRNVVLGARIGEGRIFAANPLIAYASYFNFNEKFDEVIKKIPGLDSNNIRLLFTGHGHFSGIRLERSSLNRLELKSVLNRATNAKKNVRAIFTQCYGGQFGESFMPLSQGIYACAAFSNLPERKSTGCAPADYQDVIDDYFAVLLKNKKCNNLQNARDLHYEIVEKSASLDIPMLSSEYYILYGDAESYADTEKFAPPPPNGILKKVLSSGAVIYIDMVNEKIIKVMYKGKVTNPQSVNVIYEDKCSSNILSQTRPDRWTQSFYYLRYPAYATFSDDGIYHSTVQKICAPVFNLQWEPGADNPANAVVRAVLDHVQTKTETIEALSVMPKGSKITKVQRDEFYPNCITGGSLCEGFADLTQKEKLIDTSKLKAGAKNFLHYVLPNLQKNIFKRINELISFSNTWDPPRAKAMSAILDKIVKQGKGFNEDFFLRALFYNQSDIGPEYIDYNIYYARLAHLAAVTEVELTIRRKAISDPAAEHTVKIIEGFRNCEKDLF